jgi:hypothetical protein
LSEEKLYVNLNTWQSPVLTIWNPKTGWMCDPEKAIGLSFVKWDNKAAHENEIRK